MSETTQGECISCRKPKTVAECALCEGRLCKNCIQHLDEGSFSFLKETPPELSHLRYCGVCFDETVAGPLAEYQEIFERAKNIFVFFTSQKKSIPVIKRSKDAVSVKDLADRDDTILRLAFFAAELGFNALIEVEVVCKKVRNEGYQKSEWSGRGIPAEVDEVKLDRALLQDKMYR